MRTGASTVISLCLLGLVLGTGAAQAASPREELNYLYEKAALPVDLAEPISLMGALWTPKTAHRNDSSSDPLDLRVVSWSTPGEGSETGVELSASEFEDIVVEEAERLEGLVSSQPETNENTQAEAEEVDEGFTPADEGQNRRLFPVLRCPRRCDGRLPAFRCCGNCCEFALLQRVCCRRCCVRNGIFPRACTRLCSNF
uniref:Agouti domain-containing protein n=1 Tax=Chromera velia CCMP2878 TaxID=1169474 RepID=A0A0G4H3L1_9ALVE|eukprot:Cvel_24496.t1-p1 / transcript=Cvel_24496.t1 / gene=Cvel_24496 / organism=Chromera_velia_CCMP2878 / gene_product=hypothetical protein / transcript_product=hypothetical protein / location=Cvel_scaffold2656:13610-14448(+) / protein_length=198 / sequence_SO=supercontig / SO=protein_coding / is_pseudo=false